MSGVCPPEDASPIAVPIVRREIDIPVELLRLPGFLAVPRDAVGVVAFAHGSGSSRFSLRNRQVAEVLHSCGVATLLFDLLSPDEELNRQNVFDIQLLGARLTAATCYLSTEPALARLPIGYFGASTGAAAALWAAAESRDIAAIVSRGGRPDLAGPRLTQVRAPTLLIVGSRDELVLELNRDACAQLVCEADVRIVEGATHLVEEPGTLDEAARLACEWFIRYFTRHPA
jgi:putative phosphoribosyl transferase